MTLIDEENPKLIEELLKYKYILSVSLSGIVLLHAFTCIYMHLHAFTCIYMHLHAFRKKDAWLKINNNNEFSFLDYYSIYKFVKVRPIGLVDSKDKMIEIIRQYPNPSDNNIENIQKSMKEVILHILNI